MLKQSLNCNGSFWCFGAALQPRKHFNQTWKWQKIWPFLPVEAGRHLTILFLIFHTDEFTVTNKAKVTIQKSCRSGLLAKTKPLARSDCL